MKNFAFVYDAISGEFTQESLTAFISENRYVLQWLSPFSGLFLIKSDATLYALRQSISIFIRRSYFFISVVEPADSGGFLTSEMWDWFNTGLMPDEVVKKIAEARALNSINEQK